MNRLQKKCLIVSAATHGLLLLILLVGPAFFTAKDRLDTSQLLNMVSGKVVDDAMSSGGRPNNETAPPQQEQHQQPQPPPEVKPVAIKPVEPVKPLPPPKPIERTKPPITPDFTPVKPQKPAPEKTKTDDFQIVSHPPVKPQNSPKPSPVKNPADSKPTQVADNSRQIDSVVRGLNGIKSDLSSTAKIEFNGHSGDSDDLVSNYGDIVRSIYDRAWTPATSAMKSAGAITVRITIARNGRVMRSEIVSRSGDMGMDRSVQNALDSVTVIEPFPANSKDVERSYTIEFDPLNKRSL